MYLTKVKTINTAGYMMNSFISWILIICLQLRNNDNNYLQLMYILYIIVLTKIKHQAWKNYREVK